MQFTFLLKSGLPLFDRVTTHSGNSGNSEKLREFSSCRKSQGDSRNFDSLFLTQGNSGQFWFFLKFSGKFQDFFKNLREIFF